MLKPAPLLSANGFLFLLVIIISAGAFRNYNNIEDVIAARPPPGRKYRIINWADEVVDDPVFPEDCRSPWTTLSEAATVDLLSDSEPWNFDAIAYAIFSLIEFQENW